MPTICTFYGITARMYYDDHNPPHFHVFYGEYAAKIAIESGVLIAGKLPGRVESMACEWAESNKTSLMDNWVKCQNHEALQSLGPLE